MLRIDGFLFFGFLRSSICLVDILLTSLIRSFHSLDDISRNSASCQRSVMGQGSKSFVLLPQPRQLQLDFKGTVAR
jgi:hypothetical protein